MYITEEQLGVFFSQFGEVGDVSAVAKKRHCNNSPCFASHNDLQEFYLTCQDHNILDVVEGGHPHCWSCGPAGHVSRVCPGKNLAPSTPTAESATAGEAPKEAVGTEKSGQTPSGSNEWTEAVKKGKKYVIPPLPQRDVPPRKGKKQQPKEQKVLQ